MLLLAVQWGGNKHAWKSATVIGLIIGFAGLMACFVYWQWRQGEEASIPLRIAAQRSVYSSVLMSCFGMGSIELIRYYLPIYFQVIKGDTPLVSGIRFLPTVLGNLVSSIITGGLGMHIRVHSFVIFLGQNCYGARTETVCVGCSDEVWSL
jgi:hypothetical protein